MPNILNDIRINGTVEALLAVHPKTKHLDQARQFLADLLRDTTPGLARCVAPIARYLVGLDDWSTKLDRTELIEYCTKRVDVIKLLDGVEITGSLDASAEYMTGMALKLSEQFGLEAA